MGKLREMIAVLTLPGSHGSAALSGFSLGLMSTRGPVGSNTGATPYVWSMNQYKSGVKNRLAEDGEAAEAWDELEKSIVVNLADEVSARIVGSEAEIIITKTF